MSVGTMQHAPRQLNLGLIIAPAVEDAAFALCHQAFDAPERPSGPANRHGAGGAGGADGADDAGDAGDFDRLDDIGVYRLVLHILYECLARTISTRLSSMTASAWTHPDPAFGRLRATLERTAAAAAAQIVQLAGDVPPRDLWSELAGLYAPLLDLHPHVDPVTGLLRLGTAIGGERKDSGSYYTPDPLVECLLDSALEPLLTEAAAAPAPAEAILALRVCDPACGSGQFLLGAARRMAQALAFLRDGGKPTPGALSTALRDVVTHCIYGVDADATAVEICRFALWLAAGDYALPPDFLTARIRHGNSLLGATPALIDGGIPDEAYSPLEGDNPAVCKALRRQNREERDSAAAAALSRSTLSTHMSGSPTVRKNHRENHRELPNRNISDGLVADAWCAAFVWHKTASRPESPTTGDFADPPSMSDATRDEVRRLAAEYGFFHWHLAFPEVFGSGGPGGFGVLLGNPPWERFKLQDKEWFALRRPEVAGARNAAHRQRAIAALAHDSPDLLAAFRAASRQAAAESHFVRNSGRFPLCGRGDVNTYTVFAETFRDLLAPAGRAGFIVPSGIATDHTTRQFFQALMQEGSLVNFLDFENRRGIFPAVDSRVKFALVTLTGRATPVRQAEFLFFAHSVADLRDPQRRIDLSAADLALLNPNTATCPIFRTRQEADIVRGIYRRVPIFIREPDAGDAAAACHPPANLGDFNPTVAIGVCDSPPATMACEAPAASVACIASAASNPWEAGFCRMFDMANDSNRFHAAEDRAHAAEGRSNPAEGRPHAAEAGPNAAPDLKDADFLPLYEAKLLHQFDHRWATFDKAGSGTTRLVTLDEKADPGFRSIPRYWVGRAAVASRLGAQPGWLLAFRDIARSTDERTAMATVLPLAAVSHHAPLLETAASPRLQACLVANFNALVLDFVARTKVGGTHLTFFIVKQLPILPPAAYAAPRPWTGGIPLERWIADRVVELVYTTPELAPFARACGYEGPPFRWDAQRRFGLRCELDAAFFRLYGLSVAEADAVLDTFPILRRKDIAACGEYRTRRSILQLLE